MIWQFVLLTEKECVLFLGGFLADSNCYIPYQVQEQVLSLQFTSLNSSESNHSCFSYHHILFGKHERRKNKQNKKPHWLSIQGFWFCMSKSHYLKGVNHKFRRWKTDGSAMCPPWHLLLCFVTEVRKDTLITRGNIKRTWNTCFCIIFDIKTINKSSWRSCGGKALISAVLFVLAFRLFCCLDTLITAVQTLEKVLI